MLACGSSLIIEKIRPKKNLINEMIKKKVKRYKQVAVRGSIFIFKRVRKKRLPRIESPCYKCIYNSEDDDYVKLCHHIESPLKSYISFREFCCSYYKIPRNYYLIYRYDKEDKK